MYYESSSGKIVLNITKNQAKTGSHSGDCSNDILLLSNLPVIKRQLNKIDKEILKDELQGYGAWNEDELQDHEENLQRILWLACGDIEEEIN